MSIQSISLLSNPFAFHSVNVRTAIGPDDEPWFCAKDVFEALDITWSGSKASLKNTPEKWQVVLNLQTTYGEKEAIFISLPAVYKTTFSSNKPQAIAFVEWICEEVLPAIRRHGFYGKLDGRLLLNAYTQISHLVDAIANTKDAMKFKAYSMMLRNLCNLAGMPMPDLSLIGKDPKQLAIEGF